MKNDIQFVIVMVLLLTIAAMIWFDRKHPLPTIERQCEQVREVKHECVN